MTTWMNKLPSSLPTSADYWGHPPSRMVIQVLNDVLRDKNVSSMHFMNARGRYPTTREEIMPKVHEYLISQGVDVKVTQGNPAFRILGSIYGEGSSDAETFVFLEIDNNWLGIDVLSNSLSVAEKLTTEVKDMLLPMNTQQKGDVYMIVSGRNGPEITVVGKINSELILDNYASDIKEKYSVLVDMLTAPNPKGRLSILNGVPGSGKSFLIKGLLSDLADKVRFVYVPASIVGNMSGPEFAMVLSRDVDGKQIPNVLILEDADASLLSRGQDNLSKISDLLNMTDGIFGEIMDIRILATTNAKSLSIDKAITRPGRLAVNMEFDALSLEETKEVYKRVHGKEYTGKSGLTLAEIYTGEIPVDDEGKRYIGF